MIFQVLLFCMTLIRAGNAAHTGHDERSTDGSKAPKEVTFLYERPYRGFNKEFTPEEKEDKSDKLKKIDDLIAYLKNSPNPKLPLFCGPDSIFSKIQNWECTNNQWRSDFDILEVIKEKFSVNQLELCQKSSEQEAQSELKAAEKNSYSKRKLFLIVKKYPFSKASIEALILLGSLELEHGNSTVAALLLNVAQRRAKQFPSLFSEFITPRTLFKAALAYSASEQREGLDWNEEKIQTLSQLELGLKGESLQIGKKAFTYKMLEKEVSRKKEWVLKEKNSIDWESPPYFFFIPRKKKVVSFKERN